MRTRSVRSNSIVKLLAAFGFSGTKPGASVLRYILRMTLSRIVRWRLTVCLKQRNCLTKAYPPALRRSSFPYLANVCFGLILLR